MGALDGAFDGSYKAAIVSLNANEILPGVNHITVRVESDAGGTCETFIHVTGVPVITRGADRLQRNALTLTETASGRVRINYLPDANGNAYVKVFRLSGALLENRRIVADGTPISFVLNGSHGNRAVMS